THVFHPLYGRELTLVDQYLAWGEDRVCFHDDNGELRYLPTAWTSLAPPDPFAQASAGRSHFRIEDLLQLTALICRTTAGAGPDRDGGHDRCKPNCVRYVRIIMSDTLLRHVGRHSRAPSQAWSRRRADYGCKIHGQERGRHRSNLLDH